MLTATDTELRTAGPRSIIVTLIDPERAAIILAQRGMDLAIAQLIASGALSGKESTVTLAKERGLVQ